MKLPAIGIRATFAITLVFPLAGLLLFSSLWLHERVAFSSSMKSVETQVLLTTRLGALVHELQKERALSTLLSGSHGTQTADALREQRTVTDARLSELRAALREASAGDAATLAFDLDRGPLARLGEWRSSVDGRAVQPFEIAARYSELIAALLEPVPQIVAQMGERSPEVNAAVRTLSYLSILRGKERAGMQRAELIGALAAGEWKPELYRRFSATASEEETYTLLLQSFATAEQRPFITDKLQSGAVLEANKVRDAALAPGTKLDTAGADAPRWFTLQTAKIDVLRDVEDKVAKDLLATVSSQRSGATQRAELSLFAVLAFASASFLVGFFFARGVASRLGKLVGMLADAAHQIERETTTVRQSVAQQTGMASQQVTAFTEMNTTVREIAQTATSATECAEGVLKATQKVEKVSDEGQKAIDQSVAGLTKLSEQVKAIATTITELSESTQQIGDIIATVKEVAEQSDLLALNASIEAAKAGEHGRGFAVVAAEMRNLAEQSRTAAGQVKGLLGDITRGMRQSVTVTEQGSKQAEAAISLTRSAGDTIVSLTEVARDSALAAQQITTTTRQQSTGVDYMVTAVTDLTLSMSESAVQSSSLQSSAEGLTGLSTKLKDAVGQFNV